MDGHAARRRLSDQYPKRTIYGAGRGPGGLIAAGGAEVS